jgi:hypothetical protein
MKSFKAIAIIGVIVIVLDIAAVFILKIAGSIPADQYMDTLQKSLSIIVIVLVAALIVSGVISMISKKSE